MKLMTPAEDFAVRVLSRYAWPRWPAKKEALRRASYEEFIGKRRRVFFKCEHCGKDTLQQKEVHVHHIIPRIDPELGWQGLEDWCRKTLCKAEGLACLCHDCHHTVHHNDAKTRSLRSQIVGQAKTTAKPGPDRKTAPRSAGKSPE